MIKKGHAVRFWACSTLKVRLNKVSSLSSLASVALPRKATKRKGFTEKEKLGLFSFSLF